MAESDKLWRAMYRLSSDKLTWRERIKFWWKGWTTRIPKNSRPTPKNLPKPAHEMTRKEIAELWDNAVGRD